MQTLLLALLLVPSAPVPKDLAQSERDATLKILIECAKDESLQVAAVQAMGRLKHWKAEGEVRKYLDSGVPRLRCEAIAALIELGAADIKCLTVLREMEKERLVLGADSPLKYAFVTVYYSSLRNPKSAEVLAPFFTEKLDSGINEDIANGLADAYRRFAHLVPGELERKLKILQKYEPATAKVKEHEAMLRFAIAVRYADKPPKGAIEELERWWSTEMSWIDIECAQTLLRFDPKNKRAEEILNYRCREFKPDSATMVVRMVQMLASTQGQPKLFAKVGKLAFTPGINNNAQYPFAEIGRLGKASLVFEDDLERWTHTKSPAAKCAAIEALIRLKPESREKYEPMLLAACFNSKMPYEASCALDCLISLEVSTKELKIHLERTLRESEPLSISAKQAAQALARIDPDNSTATDWIETRLKAWHQDRLNAPNTGRYNLVPQMLTSVGPAGRKHAPLLIALLRDGERAVPYSEVIVAIEAVTRPLPK